jgi:hypothetical protein
MSNRRVKGVAERPAALPPGAMIRRGPPRPHPLRGTAWSCRGAAETRRLVLASRHAMNPAFLAADWHRHRSKASKPPGDYGSTSMILLPRAPR